MIATIRVAVLAAVVSLMASPVWADQITSGSLIFATSPLTIRLMSDTFTFDGRASLFSGIFTARDQCNFSICGPGTTVDLSARWDGMDLPGTASLGGRTFLRVGSLSSDSSLTAAWGGLLTIPMDFTSGALSTGFGFTGRFYYEDSPAVFRVLDLFGSGTATAVFTPSRTFPNQVVLQSLRYDFDGPPSPTPEPASMVLLGSGLAALAGARRLRRQSVTGERDDPAA